MSIQVYDSLTRTIRPLQAREPGPVRLYVCGPTVYDDCHIGHLMGPVLFDTIARWLRQRGAEVRFVNNITDIDDKIIRRAQETGEPWTAIAERYTQQYFELLEELGVETVTDHPRCTEYVPAMVRFVAELVAADRAYVAADGVYFDVARHRGYGKLSGRCLEDELSGARVEASEGLRHPADFALWKFAKPGEPTWDSPWGAGRPGWHLECSVMSRELLGPVFELHGGGDDLKFPHHENEIAQSEAYGDAFAQVWMHHGLVQYGGRKVAKSDPRMRDPEFAQQFQMRWLIDHYAAPALRFFLLRGHYRRPIDFEPQNLAAARTGLLRMMRSLAPLLDDDEPVALGAILAGDAPGELAEHRRRFCEAMDADFNTGEAIAELFSIARLANRLDGGERDRALRMLRDLGRLLGLFRPGDLARLDAVRGGDEVLQPVIGALVGLCHEARARQDVTTADALRDALASLGIALRDGEPRWELDTSGSVPELDPLVAAAIEIRAAARKRRDFATADALRDRLAAAGIELHDGTAGTTWQLGT